MDVKALASKFKITNVRAIDKAEEFVRLLRIKFSRASSWTHGEEMKTVGCLELAAKWLHLPFDRKLAVRVSGCGNDAQYSKALQILQTVLGIKDSVSLSELCVQFGCTQLGSFANDLLNTYKERFIQTIPPNARAFTEFSRPVFKAAAFYLAAKTKKVSVDRKRLKQVCECSDKEIQTTCESILKLCSDLVQLPERPPKPAGPSAGSKSKSKSKAADGDLDAEDDDADVSLPFRMSERGGDDEPGKRIDSDSDIDDRELTEDAEHNPLMAKRKQRADDYNAWKERVLSKPPATFKQQRGSVPTKVIGGSNSASVTFGSTSASPAGGGTAPSVSSPKRTTTNGDVQPADGNVARPAWPRKRAKSNGSGSNGDSMNYGVLQASESKHVDEAAAGQTVVGSNGVDSGDRMQRRQSPNAGKRVSRSSPAAAVSSSVVANVDNDDAPTERKKHCGMRQLQLNFLRVGDKDTR